MPDFRALPTEAFGPRAKLETSKDPGEMSSSAFFVGSADEPPAAALAGCDTGVSAAPSVGLPPPPPPPPPRVSARAWGIPG